VAVPSLLNVASLFPKMPDAQLFHTPVISGHLFPWLPSGLAAAECRRLSGRLSWSSPPETDLSILPIVPPVEPACGNAGQGATNRASRSTGGTIGKTGKSVSGTDEEEAQQPSPKPERRTATTRSHDTAINLTGRWSGDDGGTYTIRQSGSKVSWEYVGALATNTFNGVIRDGVIEGRWVDHPPGILRYSGVLNTRIVDANRMEKVSSSPPNYGTSVWTRQGK
jgi:hypothetical protein